MSLLTRTTRTQLTEALDSLEVLDMASGRALLLRDLPPELRRTIGRSDTKIIDLANIVEACDRWEPDPASGQDHPLRILVENAIGLAPGNAAFKTVLATLPPGRAAVSSTATASTPAGPLPAVNPARTAEVKAAFGTLLAALDELGNPELLDKARQLRAAVTQEEPDLEHIVELRRYFASRPGKAREAAALFFDAPAVRRLIAEATQREYGGA